MSIPRGGAPSAAAADAAASDGGAEEELLLLLLLLFPSIFLLPADESKSNGSERKATGRRFVPHQEKGGNQSADAKLAFRPMRTAWRTARRWVRGEAEISRSTYR